MDYLVAIIGFVGGFGLLAFVLKKAEEGLSIEEAEKKKGRLLIKTQKEVSGILDEVKDNVEAEKKRMEETLQLLAKQTARAEENVAHKSETLLNRQQELDAFKAEAAAVQVEIDRNKELLEKVDDEMLLALMKKTGKSLEQVKKELFSSFDSEFEHESQLTIQKKEEAVREDLEKLAKSYVLDIIQRYAKESSVEKRYSVLAVPKDSVKGLLVGENAKNIEFFEEKTEATVIFNDAPNTIIISHYSLFRQEIAFMAMSALLREREINEEKILGAIEKAEKDIDETLLKIGREAAERLDLHGYPDEFLKLIGRLKFRTSFGQNILSHSFEVAAFGRMMAGEIGSDIREAELACFFHDIGKAIDQDKDVTKPHDVLSMEILKEYGFPESIVYAAYAHHDSVPPKHTVDFLVKAADAISASRPGARQETLEKYLEKIRALEGIAYSKEGVEKAYAISAGREVRVFVNPDKVADVKVPEVAKSIAEEVEENVVYPGKIKINVIRRTEAVDYVNKKK